MPRPARRPRAARRPPAAPAARGFSQVGSFATFAAARRAAADHKEGETRIEEVKLNGRTLYRVQVATRAAAAAPACAGNARRHGNCGRSGEIASR